MQPTHRPNKMKLSVDILSLAAATTPCRVCGSPARRRLVRFLSDGNGSSDQEQCKCCDVNAVILFPSHETRNPRRECPHRFEL